MANRTWVLHVILTADRDSEAAQLSIRDVLGESVGSEPLRALVDAIERWAPGELDAQIIITRNQSDDRDYTDGGA